MLEFEDFMEDSEISRRAKSQKFYAMLQKLTAKRKLKRMEYPLDRVQIFDFYRFFSRFGKVKHSMIRNRAWGPCFMEAAIVYRDFVVTVYHETMFGSYACGIYHRKISETRKLWKALVKWMKENSVLRGKEFTYPILGKIRTSYVSYINDATKKLVEENTILFFRKLRHLRSLRLKAKRGVILYGNPGNGKTSICRYISRNLPGVTRIWVTDWHMDPENISEVFEIARNFSPSIIFLEDIDTIGVSRRMIGRINSMLGKLLNEMDGIRDNNGIVVVATTNDIHMLDSALANRPGRFDLKIHIGNPHPKIIKRITGHDDNITLAEAFRRKHDKIYYERILGKKYQPPLRRSSVSYIG